MKWSWKVARISDIDISIHLTFFLLLLWIGISYWQHTQDINAVVQGVGLILVLFGCVVLHEFGHALTARRFGTITRSITLLPIGGVAAMEKMPEDPRQEMLVAVAGPAVNLFIAAVLWLWFALSPIQVIGDSTLTADVPFLYKVMVLNLMLAVFNMLPAFPMDGGRVLRAAMAMRMGREPATRWAASIGQGLAVVMFALGLLYNPFLMLIAAFIWLGAAGEASSEQMHTALFKSTAGHSMITQFDSLKATDQLQRAADLTLQTTQKHFPVLAQGQAPRLLTQKSLLQGLREYGEHAEVQQLILAELTCVDEHEAMEVIFQQLRSMDTPLVGVTRHNELAGVIDLENVVELINIEQAIKAHRRADSSRLM
jgi:Zn-dependent protease